MKKMKKLLIANRGEIALRLIRACKDYGLTSVAVYADADADAPFVARADEAYALKGTSPKDTYLDIEKLIALAKRSGADALHPGYGFLSERAEFAAAALAAGLTWIGPDPEAIAALGDKLGARKIARQAGAPLAAGSEGPVESAAAARAFAERFGLPIILKAAHGGGGRGMRIARALDEVAPLFEAAEREAIAAFGRGECFAEQFLERARHIEVQVLADRQGGIWILGTRDCSLQRRNQKLIEEAPAPFLTEAQRQTFHRAARDICAAAGYVGAGTVEFLLSAQGVISFLEVNARLQVEHPVTEETSGIDLVIEQFRIAEGYPLRTLDPPAPRGHSIEFRINIEDPGRGFLPASGRVERFSPPSGPGVRLDSGIETGSIVAPMFDSLAAKLILSGATRAQAIARARRALAEFILEGVPSVLPFHRAVLQHPDFCSEDFRVHTNWIEREFAETLPSLARPLPPKGAGIERLPLEIDGKRVELGLPASFLARIFRPGGPSLEGPSPHGALEAEAKAGELRAPFAGVLVRWEAGDGAAVTPGQVLAVIEAMKMETPLKADRGGRLHWIAKAGGFLPEGSLLARISE